MRCGLSIDDAVTTGVICAADGSVAHLRRIPTVSADWFAAAEQVLHTLADGRGARPFQSVCFAIAPVMRHALADAKVGQSLARVAVLRARPRPQETAPFARHGISGIHRMLADVAAVRGGHDIFGEQRAELDVDAVGALADRWVADGIRAIAVVACGAVVVPDHETQIAEYLAVRHPELSVWLSHQCGGLGFAQREALTALYALLSLRSNQIADRLDTVLDGIGMRGNGFVLTTASGRYTIEHFRQFSLAAAGSDLAGVVLGAVGHGAKCAVAYAHDDLLGIAPVVEGFSSVPIIPKWSPDLDIATSNLWPTVVPISDLPAERRVWCAALYEMPVTIVNDGVSPADLELVIDFVRRHQPQSVRVLDRPAELRAISAAMSEPLSDVQVVGNAVTARDLQELKDMAIDRAFSKLAASGGAPGTEQVVRVETVPLPFLLGGTYVIRIKAVSRELGAATGAVRSTE